MAAASIVIGWCRPLLLLQVINNTLRGVCFLINKRPWNREQPPHSGLLEDSPNERIAAALLPIVIWGLRSLFSRRGREGLLTIHGRGGGRGRVCVIAGYTLNLTSCQPDLISGRAILECCCSRGP